MIHALTFLLKIIITIIALFMFWLNLFIVVIMWDGSYMKTDLLIDKIWGESK